MGILGLHVKGIGEVFEEKSGYFDKEQLDYQSSLIFRSISL